MNTDGERKLRFRGLKKDKWEITPLVQIGTDAEYRQEIKPLRERGLLAEGYDEPIRNLNYMVPCDIESDTFLDGYNGGYCIYVSALRGNDSNDGTTRETPKRTIQAACDTAYDRGDSHIIILDSEVYTERLDIIDKHIFADEGQTPRLAYPLRAFDLFGRTSALQSSTSQYTNLSPTLDVNILFGLKPCIVSSPRVYGDILPGSISFSIYPTQKPLGTNMPLPIITYDETIFTGLEGYTAYNYETGNEYTIDVINNENLARVIYFTSPMGNLQGHITWAIYPGSAVFVASDGDDNASGNIDGPKHTIQTAINTAVQRGYSDVVILDSAYYSEQSIELFGRTLKKLSGENPTVVSQRTVLSMHEHNNYYQFAEYEYNGKPCIYAATHNGLLRWKNDNTNLWEHVSEFGANVISGITVWQDRCIMSSYGENRLVEITKEGAKIGNPAGIGRNFLSNELPTHLFALGDKLLLYTAGLSYGYIYNGTEWEKGYFNNTYLDGYIDRFANHDIFYNRNFSTRFACYIFNGRNRNVLVVDLETLEIRQRNFTAFCCVEHGGNIYIVDGAGIARFAGQDYEQVVRVAALTWQSAPAYIFFDTSGLCYVVCQHYTICSRDMQNWVQIQNICTVTGVSNRVYTIGNMHVAASYSWLSMWDRQHIRKRHSNELCLLYGLELDGQGMALTALDAGISLTNCSIANYSTLVNPLDTSLRYFRMSRFCNIGAVFAIGESDSFYRRVYIYDCEFIRSPVTLAAHAEIYRSSITLTNVGLMILSSTCRIAECILSGNTVDILLQGGSLEIESCLYETAQGAPVRGIASGDRPVRYVGSPLFVDPEHGDLRLKSRALGYPLDSPLLRDTARGPAVELTEMIGARRYSRRLTEAAYALDYTLRINPDRIAPSWQAANYNKIYSASGALYGRETHPGAYKVAKVLSWERAGGEEADPARQAAMMRYIYSLDTVLDIGETTDGRGWAARFAGHILPGTGVRLVLDRNTETCAPNEYAGAWCTDGEGQTLGRIVRHSAPRRPTSAEAESYALAPSERYTLDPGEDWVVDIDWGEQDVPFEGAALHVDAFRRYRIDKGQAFALASPVPYAPGRLPEIPVQYEITICEVDE